MQVSHGLLGTRSLAITAGAPPGASLTLAFSFDSPHVSFAGGGNTSNLPQLGSPLVTVFGSHLPAGLATPSIRLGNTAAESTNWTSLSTLVCRSAAGVGRTHSAVLTAGHGSLGSITSALSFDSPTLSGASHLNFATAGGAAVTLRGSGLFTSGLSATVRIVGSAAQASLWISSSSISCKTPKGISLALGSGVITVGRLRASLTSALT